jgi:pyruvate dehydrogenase E1 component beta subunit
MISTAVHHETLSTAQAINRALRDAMAEDPTVLVLGEDVGPLGGVFRVTDGLTAEFGEDRCFDTPLAEAGIAGFAVGLAMNGMRPVIEMQFDAFAYPAFEQVVSHIAKMRNRTRGRVGLPLVIRVPYAGGVGGVEHHCDSSESYYAHTPGLHVVAPSNPSDAYWLLREAIASPDPVVFLEPKKLYWAKGEVSPGRGGGSGDGGDGSDGGGRGGGVPGIGTAVVRRAGTDATLIAYGPAVPVALEAAEAAAVDGRSLQVVDLRSLVPFDDATVCAAVESTGRAVVVAEAAGFASVASEIAARVGERCFYSLAAPVRRVTGFDIPYPPPRLEHVQLPSVDRILDAVDDLGWEDA